MKRTATVEVDVCDFCKKEDGWKTCLGCHRISCNQCEESGTVKCLWSSIYGGSKHFVCPECEADHSRIQEPYMSLYRALQAVARLANEKEAFDTDFYPRSKAAETSLEAIKGRVYALEEKQRKEREQEKAAKCC